MGGDSKQSGIVMALDGFEQIAADIDALSIADFGHPAQQILVMLACRGGGEGMSANRLIGTVSSRPPTVAILPSRLPAPLSRWQASQQTLQYL
jgi:hypothetical protein